MIRILRFAQVGRREQAQEPVTVARQQQRWLSPREVEEKGKDEKDFSCLYFSFSQKKALALAILP